MGRGKVVCKGKNRDGISCNNWALRNSYYCQLHQYQVTEKDQSDMQKVNVSSNIILIVIIIAGFLISMIAGCGDGFLKWMTH